MLNIDKRYIFILLAVALVIFADQYERESEQVYIEATEETRENNIESEESIENNKENDIYIKLDGTRIEYKEIPYEDITDSWED